MTGTIIQVQKFFLSVRQVFKNQTSGLRSLISIFRFVIFVRFHFVFFYFLFFPKRYYCNCLKICVALLTFLSGKFKPKSDILRLKISESKYKIKGLVKANCSLFWFILIKIEEGRIFFVQKVHH